MNKQKSINQDLPKALFVGNGIHRAFPDNAVSWSNLLAQLRDSNTVRQLMRGIENVNLSNPLKPFPFAFEELINNGEDGNENCIKILKEEISRIFITQIENNLNPFNEFHQRIMNSSVTDVITSNYDYGFEMAIWDDFLDNPQQKRQASLNNLEKTKSIFRGYEIIKPDESFVKVWHMHGELFNSRNNQNTIYDFPEQSILIGYSHYGKYLSEIKDFVEGNYKNYDNIYKRINNNDNLGHSWIDNFFTHNLDIVGLGLGFEEQDLWWLINYRADKINSNLQRDNFAPNRIRFFIRKYEHLANDEDERFRNKIDWFKNDAIKEILTSLKVEVREIETDTWPQFYSLVLNEILD
jgi:hypothetical protein